MALFATIRVCTALAVCEFFLCEMVSAREAPGVPSAWIAPVEEILAFSKLAASPDGKLVAYVSLVPPVGGGTVIRSAQTGAPKNVGASRIFAVDLESGGSFEICSNIGGSNWHPAWSPNGDELAFYSDADGEVRLWIYDHRTRACRRASATSMNPSVFIVGDGPQWGADGKTIFARTSQRHDSVKAGSPAGDVARPRPTALTVKSSLRAHAQQEIPQSPDKDKNRSVVTDLSVIDTASGLTRVIVPREKSPYPHMMKVSPSGAWVAYVSNHYYDAGPGHQFVRDLAVVPASGGEPVVIAEGLGLQAHGYDLGYAWHPSEDRLFYIKQGVLWSVDMKGTSAPKHSAMNVGFEPIVDSIHYFTANGQALILGADLSSEKTGRRPRPRSLVVLPLDGKPARKHVIDLSERQWQYINVVNSGGVAWQPDQGSIALLLQEQKTGMRSIVRLELGTGQLRTMWKGDGLIGGAGGDLFAFNAKSNRLYAIYEDYNTPQGLYRLAGNSLTMSRIVNIDSTGNAVRKILGRVEYFYTRVPRHDGSLTTARTAVLLPPGAERGDRLHAVVMVYPGDDRSQDAKEFAAGNWGTSAPNSLFTAAGFVVLMVDATLGPMGERGNVGRELVDYVLPQVYRAGELGYIDIDRVAIAGQSGGGFASAMIISKTNLFRAAITVNGHYDMPGFTFAGISSGGVIESSILRYGEKPWSNIKRYLDNSPYYQADKIETPTLVISGEGDEFAYDANLFYNALENLGKEVMLLSYRDEGHILDQWSAVNLRDVSERMIVFLRKYLSIGGERVHLNGDLGR